MSGIDPFAKKLKMNPSQNISSPNNIDPVVDLNDTLNTNPYYLLSDSQFEELENESINQNLPPVLPPKTKKKGTHRKVTFSYSFPTTCTRWIFTGSTK